MNPFDAAWDFFKASGRHSIADPSASEGSSGGHMSRKERMGPNIGNLHSAELAEGRAQEEVDDFIDEEGRQRRREEWPSTPSELKETGPPPADYFEEDAADAPTVSPELLEQHLSDPEAWMRQEQELLDYVPEQDRDDESIYEDLPDEAFPERGPPQAPPANLGKNPRGYFQRSEPFDAAWNLLKQYGAARAMGWDVPTDWATRMQTQPVLQQPVQTPDATNTMDATGQAQQDAQAFGQHLAGTTVGNVAQGGTLSVPGLTHITQAPNTFQRPAHGGPGGTELSAPGGY